jgi:hypothetical protein
MAVSGGGAAVILPEQKNEHVITFYSLPEERGW